jgi:hypothetical protein
MTSAEIDTAIAEHLTDNGSRRRSSKRPAPRLVDGVEIMARILHPGVSLGRPGVAIPFSRVLW